MTKPEFSRGFTEGSQGEIPLPGHEGEGVRVSDPSQGEGDEFRG